MSAKGKGISVSIPKSKSTGTLAAAAAVKGVAVASSGLTVVKKPAVPVEGLSETALQEFLHGGEGDRVARLDAWIAKADEKSCLSIAQIVGRTGILATDGAHVVTSALALSQHADAAAKERGLVVLRSLLKHVGRGLEPLLCPLLPGLLTDHADRSGGVRDQSSLLLKELMETVCPHAFRTALYPHLRAAWIAEDWRIKVAALTALKIVAPRSPIQISPLLPEIIPMVSDCILDAKKQVQTTAMEAMVAACQAITNDDIRPLVPQLVSVIARPDESEKTLNLFLETTFVATVDAAVLALIAPLLGKALKSRSSAMKRKAARVIDIMCRLVVHPSDVAPFVPLLLPALDKVIDELVEAEVLEVAAATREVLLQAMREGFVSKAKPRASAATLLDQNAVYAHLLDALTPLLPLDPAAADSFVRQMAEYVAHVVAVQLVFATQPSPLLTEGFIGDTWRAQVAMVSHEDWSGLVVPYLKQLFGDDASGESPEYTVCTSFRSAALGDVADDQFGSEGDDASLCNIEFSLAFGGKILLHKTYLRLGRGRRYGVLGKNGAGKTTLLTNIGSGNIEGLPTHLRTIYVQHDNATDDYGVPVIDELLLSKELVAAKVSRANAELELKGIGFTDDMLEGPRSALSGGWKMKLLLIKAVLSKADVLLLDEPTNHLDAASVEWLTRHVLAQTDVTCLVVSHDTVFLDRVLTDVIHFEDKKLVYYHGNLSHFVHIHPEARSYYQLEESALSFKFPVPERLEGINSNTRSIIKLENVQYTYPGRPEPTLRNVNVKVCLGSRIAVLGANGAGKSTLIKLLVQETLPDEGTDAVVWKHMNLRVAYVAQHSFHHVEQHMDSSPVDYIKWRFFGGVDKESMNKATTKLTDEEKEVKKERKYGDVDEVLGRRKNGRTMEYECTFIGQNPAREPNKYVPLEQMAEMGLQKLVEQCDARIAAMAAGLDLRPLVTHEIQGHLNDFGLDAEFGTHSTIKRLSGGQKVKLVLASAMWNRPHVLVLDEPTNYLDREALGALTKAIQDFGGGVLIISHNKEFTDALCNEQWWVKDGLCYTEGGVTEDGAVKAMSSNKIKKSQSATDMKPKEGAEVGNTNSVINAEVILNPRTLEGLSKKEQRKLERCAAVAGVSLKEYVSKITCKSPEWKWL